MGNSRTEKYYLFAKHMKRAVILVAAGSVLLMIGFVAGVFYQNVRSGYHYTLLEEKDYASPFGPVHWSCFMETVGFSFLGLENTMIRVGNRTIYKAQRDFQENNPRALNIESSSNSIAWKDGDYRYHLTMEAMNDEPDPLANSHAPASAQ